MLPPASQAKNEPADSLNCDPLRARGEEFFLRVDGDHVRAQRADATIWAEGDLWHQAGVVFVKPFKSRDDAFAAEVFAAELQGVNQDPRCRNRRRLRRRVCRLELVPL